MTGDQQVTVEGAYRIAVEHHQAGRLNEAEAICRHLIAQVPGFPDAHHMLGLLLHQAGHSEEALPVLENALALMPDNPAVHFNLGNALKATGDLAQAVSHYRIVIGTLPDNPDVLNNFGTALHELGDLAEAEIHLRRATQVQPSSCNAWANLCTVLADFGKYSDAEKAGRQAVTIAPEFGNAHYNLGNALSQQHRLEEAIHHFQEAIRLEPALAIAHNNLANAFLAQGRFTEATLEYQRTTELAPQVPLFHSNFVSSLQYGGNDDQVIATAAGKWAAQHGSPPVGEVVPLANNPDPDRPLRIGYVSPDFRRHSVAWFADAFICAHDQEQFAVTCYYNNGFEDEVTERFRNASNTWRDIFNLSDEATAKIVRDDGIDILIDLAGHSMKNRMPLFALHPAPVQATYLGFPGTTGLETIDYRLTDAWADPEGGGDQWYTEQLVRLEGGFLCYTPPSAAPDVGPVPALGARQVTFGSFNNLSKLTPEAINVWAKILDAVPGSRLILKTKALTDTGAQERVRELFQNNGIAGDRLELLALVPDTMGHLSVYNRVDIALDTFPYNGTTTTVEALWMGVPTITLSGDRHASRVGTSIMNMVGLDNLIATQEDEYVAKAAALATNLDELAELRSGMRDRMRGSRLLDAEGFTRTLEGAYRQMWRTWCAST